MGASAPRAVIAIGSNSVRMIVARVGEDGLSDVRRYREDVRAFAGLTAQGLSDETQVRLMMAIMRLWAAARAAGVGETALTATSATRDAANAEAFAAKIRQGMGLKLRILTGDEEARLGFAGATANSQRLRGMIDIGGGSTELAVGRGGEPTAQLSLQLGAARLERVITNEATPDSVLDGLIQNFVEARKLLPPTLPSHWFGVGGTFHTLARIDSEGQHDIEGYNLHRNKVERIADALYRMPIEQRMNVPGLAASRVDIIVPGAWIALACMKALELTTVIVTERGNLDGTLLHPPIGLFNE